MKPPEPANDPAVIAALPDLSLVPVQKVEALVRCCGNCDAFQPTSPDGKVGTCRRNPPVPLVVGMGQGLHGRPVPAVDGYFPPTNINIWCAQFAPRETAAPAPDFVTVGERQ